LLFTRNIIDFHSFLCATLHFVVTGQIENLTAVPDTHSISLSWIHSNESENCNGSYAIVWEDVADGSRNCSGFLNNNSYVIDNLEACVTFDIYDHDVSCNESDGSRNCSGFSNIITYVIDNLEACVTFDIYVRDVSCNESEAEIKNVTTLPDGKWHVMCRFMACAYTTSYSECIQYSHQLKLLLQISYT